MEADKKCGQVLRIEQYGAKVMDREVSCSVSQCPRCSAKKYWRNGVRNRKFLVIFKNLIYTAMSALSLWKCAHCGKSVTLYPGFALPYKRYTRMNIMEISQRFVREDRLSYLSGVKMDRMEIGYVEEDSRLLFPSTLHRWVSTLGGFNKTIRSVLDLITQKNPTSSICRDLAGLRVASRKWRKAGRETVLLNCYRLCLVEDDFQACYKASIFPDLAMGCSWS